MHIGLDLNLSSSSVVHGKSPNEAFEFTVTTTGSAETFTLPCGNTGTYNAVIDWGDGEATSTITTYNDADLTHTYADSGTYAVSISGSLPWVYFFDAGDKLKLTEITNWGQVGVLTLSRSFQGCSNMTCSATDTPDISNVTSMFYCFNGCSLFNGRIGSWDVSSVTTLDRVLYGCSAFNRDLSDWDVSKVTNFNHVFWGCSEFDQDITSWDISSAETMIAMFQGCAKFNIDVTVWDVSNVTNLSHMFRDATIFNQDLSDWDTTGCTTFNNFVLSSGLDQANVDNLYLGFYTRRASHGAGLSIDTSSLPTPTGAYQDGDPPTTGLEYVYELENDPEAEGFNTWSITY